MYYNLLLSKLIILGTYKVYCILWIMNLGLLINMSGFTLFIYYQNIIKENKTLKLKFKFIVIVTFKSLIKLDTEITWAFLFVF